MTPDQPPHSQHPKSSETTAPTSGSSPPKNNLLDDVIGVALGISVGWLGEIAMHSNGFALFSAS